MERKLLITGFVIIAFLASARQFAFAQSGSRVLSGVAANTQDKRAGVTYTPLQLHFTEDFHQRNFFNLSISYNQLNFDEDALDTRLYPRVNIAGALNFSKGDNGLTVTNPGTAIAESYIKIGSLLRYGAIDMDVAEQTNTTYAANAIIALQRDARNRILIVQRGTNAGVNTYTLEIFKNGTSVFTQTLTSEGIAAPYTLRLHVTGKYLNFFRVKKEKWKYFATVDIGDYFDLRADSVIRGFSVLAGARLAPGERVSINRLAQYLSGGTGQADPRVLHYESGEPIIENNKIWIAMTIRGYRPIPSSHQGIFSYDINTKKFELVGDMSFDKGDGLKRPWHASDIFLDRKDHTWKVLTVSHGDDHKIYAGICPNDPRKGISEVQVKLLNYPSGGDEDPSVIFDRAAAKWRLVMCRPGGGGFKTAMFESATWNGPYTQIAEYTPISTTGNLIQKVGGKYYVFLGRGSANYEVLSYPDLVKIGTLNADPLLTAKNVWPVIIPISSQAKTDYYLLTFDRAGVTGAYSYGNLYWYKAGETAEGFREY